MMLMSVEQAIDYIEKEDSDWSAGEGFAFIFVNFYLFQSRLTGITNHAADLTALHRDMIPAVTEY